MWTKRCPYCAEEIQSEAIKCKHCQSWLDGRSPSDEPLRRLTRSKTDSMVAGVCGGLGHYFNVDPTLVRLVYVLILCFTVVVPALVAYVVLMIVVPSEDEV